MRSTRSTQNRQTFFFRTYWRFPRLCGPPPPPDGLGPRDDGACGASAIEILPDLACGGRLLASGCRGGLAGAGRSAPLELFDEFVVARAHGQVNVKALAQLLHAVRHSPRAPLLHRLDLGALFSG